MPFSFFRKKPVRFLGRAGLLFDYRDKVYFIDCEMLFGDDADIVVFKGSVQINDSNEAISDEHKQEVVDCLLSYLREKEHLKVAVTR